MKITKVKGASVFIFWFIYAFIACIKPSDIPAQQQEALVFSTWEGFEADKCASIWLIKRYIDKNAVIKFFPKEKL